MFRIVRRKGTGRNGPCLFQEATMLRPAHGGIFFSASGGNGPGNGNPVEVWRA
ncbi:hypothetical protein ASZ90_000366 [hydrocarbon metagenome]|uniref:Uncharacterized protein n=1 Tax=hydrocarbon metagenome TaxID=938273 RepID=A0A0W8G9C9_9ZZZZ